MYIPFTYFLTLIGLAKSSRLIAPQIHLKTVQPYKTRCWLPLNKRIIGSINDGDKTRHNFTKAPTWFVRDWHGII